MNKILFYISLFSYFLCSWVNLELIFSSYDWWYWTEVSGYKWIYLLAVVLPLFFISIVIRLLSKVNLTYKIDIYYGIIYFLYYVAGFIWGKEIAIFSNNKIFILLGVINLLIVFIVFLIYLIRIFNNYETDQKRAQA